MHWNAFLLSNSHKTPILKESVLISCWFSVTSELLSFFHISLTNPDMRYVDFAWTQSDAVSWKVELFVCVLRVEVEGHYWFTPKPQLHPPEQTGKRCGCMWGQKRGCRRETDEDRGIMTDRWRTEKKDCYRKSRMKKLVNLRMFSCITKTTQWLMFLPNFWTIP